jgi:capsular exopolysaccharide synthesis family protein
MSRIHEAIKRAEEERSGQRPEENRTTLALESPVAATAAARPARPADGSIPVRSVQWHPDTRSLIFTQGHQAAGGEEFRTLRSRLYKIREQQPLQSLLISSALPGEGKTFVTANLAMALARQHERTIVVIDADLRKPRLHTVLGAPMTPGLADFLSGKVEIDAILQRGPLENLCLIPGGSMTANPSELVSSSRMKGLIEKLQKQFDWVVIDSPPIIPVSDASVIADLCHGVLVVVQAGSTPADLAQKACQEFREKHLLGAVLNRSERGTGYHSHYYYYGYGEKPASD